MRVVFFHAYPHQYAGAQRLTHALADELVRSGHEVIVVLPDEGPYADRLRLGGIAVRVTQAPASWRAYGRALEQRGALRALYDLPRYWLRLRSAFRELRPDVVHINDHRGILLGGVPARAARAPVVWHLHGPYPSRSITLLGRLTARRILVVSTATRREQVGLARRSEQVMTLHNGLIGGPPGDRPRPRHRGASPQRLVVTGARHHPDKGLDVLIRAFAIVRAAEPSARAVIAGAVQPGYEEHHDELVRLIVRLGLQDAISMPGLISDPLPLWAEADVYVQPSRREPFGLGLIEAMSVGTPVIATSVGGMTEIVEADRSGLQVPPDDPDALAEAIRRVLTDAELATRLATGGLDRAQQFSMQRMVDRLCAVYAEATA